MGLFLSSSKLGIPFEIPFGIAPVNSQFQSWDKIHLAIRTGFCGSLTTYSSWNSEMIVMIFGTGSNYQTQWIRALFGYIIGIELALSSFTAGKNLALKIHRRLHPELAREADALKNNPFLCINNNLPGFERRYLADIFVEDEIHEANPTALAELGRWKMSTSKDRGFHKERNDILQKVETLVIVEKVNPINEYGHIINDLDWNLDALVMWTVQNNQDLPLLPRNPPSYNIQRIRFAGPIFFVILISLLMGLIFENGNDQYSLTYRSMWYSALLAPPGALLRWKLGPLNGTLNGSFYWLPLGTLAANVLGSIDTAFPLTAMA